MSTVFSTSSPPPPEARPAAPSGRVPGLADALRHATADAHAQAEGNPFVEALLSGRVEPQAYLRWLVALHSLYGALEQGLRKELDPPQGGAMPADVFRAEALEHDIAYWCLRLGCAAPVAVPSASDYAEHLRELAQRAPRRLLAHAYVRYLGDLSGGRLMRQGLQHLGEPHGTTARTSDPAASPHPGMAFFRYPEGASLGGLRDQVRAALQTAGDDMGDWQDVLDEAVDAFARHRTMMDEVAQAGTADAGASIG